MGLSRLVSSLNGTLRHILDGLHEGKDPRSLRDELVHFERLRSESNAEEVGACMVELLKPLDKMRLSVMLTQASSPIVFGWRWTKRRSESCVVHADALASILAFVQPFIVSFGDVEDHVDTLGKLFTRHFPSQKTISSRHSRRFTSFAVLAADPEAFSPLEQKLSAHVLVLHGQLNCPCMNFLFSSFVSVPAIAVLHLHISRAKAQIELGLSGNLFNQGTTNATLVFLHDCVVGDVRHDNIVSYIKSLKPGPHDVSCIPHRDTETEDAWDRTLGKARDLLEQLEASLLRSPSVPFLDVLRHQNERVKFADPGRSVALRRLSVEATRVLADMPMSLLQGNAAGKLPELCPRLHDEQEITRVKSRMESWTVDGDGVVRITQISEPTKEKLQGEIGRLRNQQKSRQKTQIVQLLQNIIT